jgi:hypothetical protein
VGDYGTGYCAMDDALKRSMGEASFAETRERFEKRIQSHDFIEVENKS